MKYNTIIKDLKNTNSQKLIDLTNFWRENDSLRNTGFKSDNILIKPENLTQLIFILSVLDMEEKTLLKSQNLTIEANTNAYLLSKEIMLIINKN